MTRSPAAPRARTAGPTIPPLAQPRRRQQARAAETYPTAPGPADPSGTDATPVERDRHHPARTPTSCSPVWPCRSRDQQRPQRHRQHHQQHHRRRSAPATATARITTMIPAINTPVPNSPRPAEPRRTRPPPIPIRPLPRHLPGHLPHPLRTIRTRLGAQARPPARAARDAPAARGDAPPRQPTPSLRGPGARRRRRA